MKIIQPYFKKGSLITIKVVENLYKGSKKSEKEQPQQKKNAVASPTSVNANTTTSNKEKVAITKNEEKNNQNQNQPKKKLEKKTELEVGPEKKITGICIKKTNRGRDSYVELKYVINNESIRQKFPLYSPFVFFSVSKPLEESKQRNKL